jgi:diacylglycerol kinase (ATP)
MSPQRRALLLVNTQSRRGAEIDLTALADRFRRGGFCVDLHALEPDKPLATLVAAHGRGAAAVVLGGGDGTLSAAAPGLIACGVPLGVLPLGTANDFAKGIGIPPDLDAAVDIILQGRTRTVDLGDANGQLFFNAAGIGLGPAMTRQMNAGEKARWGRLAYPRAVLRALRRRRSHRLVVECDGVSQRLRALQLTVANGKYYGGGMTAEANVEVDDGMLNLLVVKPATNLQLLRLVPKLWRGEVTGDPNLYARWAAVVRVTANRPLPVTTDGEFTTQTPVQFRVRRGVIDVFAP